MQFPWQNEIPCNNMIYCAIPSHAVQYHSNGTYWAKRAHFGTPSRPEEAQYPAKVCGNHESNPVGPTGGSSDQICPPPPPRAPKSMVLKRYCRQACSSYHQLIFGFASDIYICQAQPKWEILRRQCCLTACYNQMQKLQMKKNLPYEFCQGQ